MIPENWQAILTEKTLYILVTIVCALILRWVVHKAINKAIQTAAASRRKLAGAGLADRAVAVLAKAQQGNQDRARQRTETLGSVLASVFDLVLVIVVALMVLSTLGLSVGPAIASAGIGGLALGFGAQSLVKDLISGVFLIFEDQFGVGDYVTINGVQGTVLKVGFRVTQLQDASGEIWYIRNGEVTKVGNQTQGWSSSYVQIPVGITEDPFKVVRILEEVVASLDAEPEWREQLLETPTVLGLSNFNDRVMNFTVMAKSPGNEQWSVEREIRARAMTVLREAGIRSPGLLVETRPYDVVNVEEHSLTRATKQDSLLRRRRRRQEPETAPAGTPAGAEPSSDDERTQPDEKPNLP
ncbi:mechanosensitive ion channel protein MscS [Enemella evansiae]|uniref:mechanosensitive ion channel family protein n=1 Tax=Enemella evansiae TaxID=2016499 RepID=UPI000B96CAF2|nr:mechanosensitive ion channel family protein [Enemella evansiae]OYN99694.1 mechanosensitive ion channel protein MscS [Enemella evansiae]OYO02836.1 mechanosensitive ion channel protein MscS [Enemella evansiae]OYO15151.1 mechanosensitive ion channel protein MscS [Enemella evansiae]OYO20221.1 mechanosensitive ion channel protein MscS [Enemella evansiae]